MMKSPRSFETADVLTAIAFGLPLVGLLTAVVAL
jgi:hypothetical protein